MAEAPPARVRRPRTLRRFLLLVPLVVAALVALAAFLSPPWWHPPASSDPERLRRAEALEQGLAAEGSRVRGAEASAWNIRILEEDANAWLALRLPRWLAHDRDLPWPADVACVQVHFRAPDLVDVGVQRGGRVEVGSFRLSLEGGRLKVELTGGGVGRLRIPLGRLVDPAQFLPELAAPVDSEVRLVDGRRVRVEDLECLDGELRLSLRTLPRSAAPPP